MELLTKIDHYLFFLINNAPGNFQFEEFVQAITRLGEWGIALIAFAFLAQTGRKVFFRHFIVMVVALMFLTPVMNSIKSSVNRDRPVKYYEKEIESKEVHIRVLGYKLKSQSFPSGHSALSFFFMTYILLFKRSYGFFSMSLATFIALSRVYVGAHFPFDCLVGSLLGMLGGALAWFGFTKIDKKNLSTS